MINVHLVSNYNITFQSVSIGQYLFCMASQRTTVICLSLELKRFKKGHQPGDKEEGFLCGWEKRIIVKCRVCEIRYLFFWSIGMLHIHP